nr:hypothetical protein HK105_007415 [Polyrhizophydium stewartii]
MNKVKTHHRIGLWERMIYKLIVAIIQSYIVDEPEWRHNVRNLVKRFKGILHRNFPGIKKILPQILRRPLPGPSPVIKYLSTRTGTIVTRKRPFPKPRAISCHDFRELWDYQSEMAEREALLSRRRKSSARTPGGDDYDFDFELEGDEREQSAEASSAASVESAAEVRGNSLRSNSYNTLADLGKRALLKRPIIKGRQEIGSQLFEDEYDDEEYDDEELESEVSTDSDNYSEVDEKYFQQFREEDIQEAVNTFLDTYPNGRERTDEEKTDADELHGLDTTREFFSMQEVIELTLLHAQQMHVMQSEYSERIARMSNQIQILHQEQAELNSEWEKRFLQAQERAQKMTQEFMLQAESRVNTTIEEEASAPASVMRRKPSKSVPESPGRESRTRRVHHPHRLSTTDEAEETPNSKLEKLKARIEKRRKLAIEKKLRAAKPKKRILPPRKPRKFTSTPMAMSFLERLRWFTEMSLRKRAESRNVVTQMEMTANEQRLAHIRHIQGDDAASTNGALTEKSALMAEFMPMPGTTFGPTKARIMSPWGGRFKTASTASNATARQNAPKINVLNLFDVAMNIRPPSPETNDE